MKYWLVVTSPPNFKLDRDVLGFKLQGLPIRFKKSVMKMELGDKVVYYIMKLQRFGAIATITGKYLEDFTKLWANDDEMWPARCPSKPEIVLEDDELIDVKKLVPNLSFIVRKDIWGVYFQGSIKPIPEEDFRLIESEMKKVVSERNKDISSISIQKMTEDKLTEKDYENLILELPLQSNSLHDRIGEMLEQIGTWMDFNTQTRHRIVPDHAYELDVAWLSVKNPEVAIEVQISGNITEAKDRLSQARKFNYRKLIIVIRESDMSRLNSLMKHEPELRSWMEAWSIGSVYNMYQAGEKFFKYYRNLIEAIYKVKSELELIR